MTTSNTQSIEITAKTVDEAKQQAASQLGVSITELKIEVLEETKKLFGRGNVRVRASIILKESTIVKESPAPKKAPARGRSKKATTEPVQPIQEDAPEPSLELDMPEEESEAPAPVASQRTASEDDAAKYLIVLREILKLANLNIKAQLKGLNGRYVQIQLDGSDLGLLITRRAETLNSLQYLLNVIVSKKIGSNIRVTLDAGEYRQRREDSLQKLAEQIAKEVILRGEEAVLDALPAFERRVIHNFLQTVEGIRTYSEGEEPNRCVVIAPAE